jgi:hypothetical protein
VVGRRCCTCLIIFLGGPMGDTRPPVAVRHADRAGDLAEVSSDRLVAGGPHEVGDRRTRPAVRSDHTDTAAMAADSCLL